jgi:hypothetical protein
MQDMFGLIIAFAGVFVVVFTVYSQMPEYKGVPKPIFCEMRRSVIIACTGILVFLLGILIERAGV